MLVELYKIDEELDYSSKSSSQDLHLINDICIRERDDNYIDTTKSDTIKSDDVRLPEVNQDLQTDFSNLEVIRIDLENRLGEGVLSKVYKIVEESVIFIFKKVTFDTVLYNHELISNGIMKALLNKVDSTLVLSCIEKIPEIFSLVVKEREAQIKRRIK